MQLLIIVYEVFKHLINGNMAVNFQCACKLKSVSLLLTLQSYVVELKPYKYVSDLQYFIDWM